MEITNKFVEESKDKKFTVTFENGKVLKNITFFNGKNDVIGYLIGRQKRNGFIFPTYNSIKSVVDTTPKKKEITDISNAKTILKKIHPNCWDNIQQELKDIIAGGETTKDFDLHFKGKLKFKNISKLMGNQYAEKFKQAFENKTQFSWERPTSHNSGRDLSASCKLCDDGIFRAWFSSEFKGCGNGDYWLLINPTTAIYYEAD